MGSRGVGPANPALFCHLKADGSHDRHAASLPPRKSPCSARAGLGQRRQGTVEFPCRHLQINGPLAPSASESHGDGRDGASEGQEDRGPPAFRSGGKADGHREPWGAPLCARATRGTVGAPSQTACGVLAALTAPHPCPSLQVPSGLGFATACPGQPVLIAALSWAGRPASSRGPL